MGRDGEKNKNKSCLHMLWANSRYVPEFDHLCREGVVSLLMTAGELDVLLPSVTKLLITVLIVWRQRRACFTTLICMQH